MEHENVESKISDEESAVFSALFIVKRLEKQGKCLSPKVLNKMVWVPPKKSIDTYQLAYEKG